MLTPVKTYKQNVSSFIAQEMVSLYSFIPALNKNLFDKNKLPMHKHYANFTGTTREMSDQLRDYGKRFRLPPELGGARCPIGEGQDFYDFLQQYISVRKVEFKNMGLINSSITVSPAQDGENGERIAQLFKDIQDNKKLSVKASLEDIIHTVVQMKAYQAIPIDAGGEVSYRAKIIQSIVSKFRSDARRELLGSVEDLGSVYDPYEGGKGIFLPVYTGPIRAFWPELAMMAAHLNYEDLHKDQGKNVFTSPAQQEKSIRKMMEEKYLDPKKKKKKK